MKNQDILCVHDNIENCKLLRSPLEYEGYRVSSCKDGNEAIEMARENTFSAIILDNWIRGMSGLHISSQIRAFDLKTPIIFFSAATFPNSVTQLVKPDVLDQIVKTVIALTATSE